MLDGILGRGFSSKCKSLMKGTTSRIELARRRAEAKQRFLKEDLVKLLTNGLDVNAYGRTEEFMAGERILSCYGYIELSCEYIMKQLSNMQKQSDCPEECREAVASLMFAAARFSDLPELRDIRDLILEKYGSGLECFVNQKFVEQLSSKTPAMEKRIQLLQDIASEFQIRWDSAGLQQRMAYAEGKPNKIEPSHSPGNYNQGNQKGIVSKTIAKNVLSVGKPEASKDNQIKTQGRDINGKQDVHSFGKKERVNEFKQVANKERSHSASEKNDIPAHKMEKYDNSHQRRQGTNGVYSEHEKTERENIKYGDVSEKKKAISTKELLDEENNNNNSLKSHCGYGRPPPYVKSKDKTSRGSEHSESNGYLIGVSSHGKESEHTKVALKDEIPLHKPKSVRSSRPKSVGDHDGKPHRHRDEEEVMIDKLLLHYSRKPSDYDIDKLRKKPSHQRDVDNNTHKTPQEMKSGGAPPHPTRSISLPHEQASPSETPKVYARANSFQPDHQARHVHPKLPDYEDLAARFAALRGG
ncbi:unnamed protein product [Cuscuta epithymum]|uniref:IST1-like protein n=1 Tax=Cuscuta epithymum TaxID=186058 RepID=A0AAV0G8J9_9ASTE|nr:unnamed protein product [Cuscuta epithymum]